MNDDIKKDIYDEKYFKYIDKYVDNIIKNNINLLNTYQILEIEYNLDGNKKDIYSLASERDIKKMQIQSDKNELDYKFSQNNINLDEYQSEIDKINKKIIDLDLLYDDLIFSIIDDTDINVIKDSILKYNLNDIDLDRLRRAISSVSENKIDEFRNNNKMFMIDKISYWNYKYNKLSKSISKAREVESFIVNLVKK